MYVFIINKQKLSKTCFEGPLISLNRKESRLITHAIRHLFFYLAILTVLELEINYQLSLSIGLHL